MNWQPIDDEDENLAYRTIGAAIEVHRHLGPGFLESIYQKAMEHELTLSGIPFERQKKITVPYKDVEIEGQQLDLLVGGRVVIELKAVESFAPIHEVAVDLVPEGNRSEARTADQLSRNHPERGSEKDRALSRWTN